MNEYGLVIVSHSDKIAQGTAELVAQVAKDISITTAGGTETGEIGTSFNRITAAIEANPAPQLLAFYDLGSAKMNLEMAQSFSDKAIQIWEVPIIEGAYTAGALLQAGVAIAEVNAQLADLRINK